MAARNPRSEKAVQRAIAAVGSQAALARALGVTAGAVSLWGSGGRPVPVDRCPQIEQETRKAAKAARNPSLVVRCEELRPDVQWAVLRKAA